MIYTERERKREIYHKGRERKREYWKQSQKSWPSLKRKRNLPHPPTVFGDSTNNASPISLLLLLLHQHPLASLHFDDLTLQLSLSVCTHREREREREMKTCRGRDTVNGHGLFVSERCLFSRVVPCSWGFITSVPPSGRSNFILLFLVNIFFFFIIFIFGKVRNLQACSLNA